MTNDEQGAKRKPEDVKSILASSDCKDVVRWFRFKESAVGGLQACDARNGSAETVTMGVPRPRSEPTTKVCRGCATSTDAEDECCPACGRRKFCFPRPKPEGEMAVKSTRRGASPRSLDKDDRQIVAVAWERRVREGLTRIPTLDFRKLQLFGESKQHGPEIRRELGQGADLAMRMPRCTTAYGRYVAGCKMETPHSLELWLTKLCQKPAEHKGLLGKIRDEWEQAIADALLAYRAVRGRPTEEEKMGVARLVKRAPGGSVTALPAKPKIKRRSVLERVREMVQAKLAAAGGAS